jgi:hypothetical protein
MTVWLEVRQQSDNCEFRLRWGEGQQLQPVPVAHPTELLAVYQQWQRAYLNFYRSFRGRVVGVGQLSELEDQRAQLVKTEASLLTEFHAWLRHRNLDGIRSQIAQLAKERAMPLSAKPDQEVHLTIFLTCSPLELERLPWEAWEIGKELGTITTVRIARTPDQIRAKPVNAVRRGRNRVLVILGDDTGLDFQADRQAVQGLATIADIHFMGWQPGQDSTALLTQITQAITDHRGWDLLLFAGHSNETATTGGELAIAPHITLSIAELAPHLEIAKRNGLQFALFNSCSGLSIARSLIDLGFNQVAVMREPIHNQVAQEFLVQFLRSMAQYKDVHEALMTASQVLKLEKNLTFPSAALIPSLFCRPGQPLFCFRKFGWREWIGQFKPTLRQAIALSVVAGLSLSLPLQGNLLEDRLWTQAVYRRLTGQVSETTLPMPITLVRIDQESIRQAGISAPNPMNRAYLAQLIDQITARQAPIVGIDYVLDRPAPRGEEDGAIADAIQNSVRQGTWLVWASISEGKGEWSTVLPGVSFPTPPSHWSLKGDIKVLGYRREQNLLPTYVTLVNPWADPAEMPLPFAYGLARVSELAAETDSAVPRPNLESQSPLITQAQAYLEQRESQRPAGSSRAYYQPITVLSYWLRQIWFQPIIDFSLPPDQVYRSIPAWQLLDETAPEFNFQNQIVLLIPGGYQEAGVRLYEDNMALPAAVRHWRSWQEDPTLDLRTIAGGEVHAYMLHHFLTQRLVVPIPDFWMVGIMAFLGKTTVLALQDRALRRDHGYLLLGGATVAYGVLSLQVFLSAAILLPWLLPSVTFWIYALPMVNRLPRHSLKPALAFA